ncbi:hypothetical protein NLJ89_g12079 [Agrocybe chaxingu]|uniref:Uncharacterized protein n=1 Tax=Agrocybe chaxingu TaxID=84603 RepID=A0A9W8JR76_9AGAR|nr:hypothetical protein NLJ89_g12079 [Agrocybe chaxingu]
MWGALPTNEFEKRWCDIPGYSTCIDRTNRIPLLMRRAEDERVHPRLNFQKLRHLRLNTLSWQPNDTEDHAFMVLEALNLSCARRIVTNLTIDYTNRAALKYIDEYLGTTYQALRPVPNWQPLADDSLPPPPTTTTTMTISSSTADDIATTSTSTSTSTPLTSMVIAPADTPATRPRPAYFAIKTRAHRLRVAARNKDICHTCGDKSFYHWSCDCAQYICHYCNTAAPGHTMTWCPRRDDDDTYSLDNEDDWDDDIYGLVDKGNGYGDW